GIRDRNVTGVQTCALPILHDSTGPFNIIRYMNDAESLLQLALTYRSFKKRLDQLNKEEFLDTIKVIGNGHDISGVLKAVSGGNRSEERRVGEECGCSGSRE